VAARHPGTGAFDAANPDNVLIDRDGGVWFGTDGNFNTNHHADAIYYLDLDDAHATTPVPTFGKAFRIAGAERRRSDRAGFQLRTWAPCSSTCSTPARVSAPGQLRRPR
jgi:hypothetical protein